LNNELTEYFYLLNYLKDNHEIAKSKIDLLKLELDKRIYYYGEHFKYPRENSSKHLMFFKDFLKEIYIKYLFLAKNLKSNNKKKIISDAYFSINDELKNINIDVLRPIHSISKNELSVGNLKVLKHFQKVKKFINYCDFYQLLGDEFNFELDKFQEILMQWYKNLNISALIVPNDIAFFEYLNIQIFKQLMRPSFIFLHGLPCRYNIYDENQTDYLIVWGERIKEHYIQLGFNPKKLIVSGHPYYKSKRYVKLRNNLDQVLVLTKSLEGAQHRDKVRLTDRGNLILYLYSIKNALKKRGVRFVRFRPHPSENPNWYFKFIDPDFFKLDTMNLSDSLKHSSLVIGPTSTVFLESIYHGVNYLVYEPTIHDIDLVGYNPVPPFDGFNKKVPVANSEKELNHLLNDKSMVDPSIFDDYISTPFDISFINKLI